MGEPRTRRRDERVDRLGDGLVDFGARVGDALAHLHDLPYLQTHPLAEYAQREGMAPPRVRGRSLQAGLNEAIAALKPRPGEPISRAHDLLHLRYVEALEVREVCGRLGMSRASFYREHRPALAAVVAVLRDRWDLPVVERLTPSRTLLQLAPRPTPARDAAPSYVPPYLTSFVGREGDLAALRRLLETTRLLTLTGVGGCGKTRLALELAARVAGSYEDGIGVIDLSALAGPDRTLAAIATALGIDPAPESADADRVRDALRSRHLLLVLDNFEQLRPAGPALLDLLQGCPRLTILVTSRAPLRVRGEQEYCLAPLTVPDPDAPADTASLAAIPAVALFVDRARSSDPAFALSPTNVRALAEISRRLDGLPLAIELAAARIRVLPPQALLVLLERRLPVLTGGAADLPDRQRTLRDTVAASYDLLSDADKRAFCRLAIFVGGCSLDAACAVLVLNRAPSPATTPQAVEVLDRLDSLIGMSLLRRGNPVVGEPRFEMLETIREFGLEQVAESGEGEDAQYQHAHYFAALVEQAEAGLTTSDHGRWMERLDADHANVRATLAWCLARDAELGLALAASLQAYWETKGHAVEGRGWLQQLLAVAEPATTQRARALVAYAEMQALGDEVFPALEEALAIFREVGDKTGVARVLAYQAALWTYRESFDRARSILHEGIPLARECGDDASLAKSLYALARIETQRGEYDHAWRLCEESLSLRRRLGNPQLVTWALGHLGNLARVRGDYLRAGELFEEGLSLIRFGGGSAGRKAGWFLASLGYLARIQGDVSHARTLVHQALAIFVRTGARDLQATALMYLGIISIDVGQVVEGTRRLATSESVIRDAQGSLDPDETADRDQCLATARAVLGNAAFGQAWAEGQAMALEQAVAYALEEVRC